MCRRGREALPDVQEWSGGHLGCPGVVGWPSRMSRSGWEALLDVQQLQGGPPVCPGVVGRPSQMSGSNGRPYRMSGSCRESLPEDWAVSPEVWE